MEIMNNEHKKLLLFQDVEKLYDKCKEVCKEILTANSKNESSFVFYKYVHFASLFNLVENYKISTVNVIYPSSKLLTPGKGYEYVALWVEKGENLNLVADFASIYIVNNDKIDILFTLPVWSVFLRKIIRLFKGAKVTYVYF